MNHDSMSSMTSAGSTTRRGESGSFVLKKRADGGATRDMAKQDLHGVPANPTERDVEVLVAPVHVA